MKELKEFEVIGYNIKLKNDEQAVGDDITAVQIASLVNSEAGKIKAENMGLENGQIATLTALKIAADILRMEKDFKENIFKLEGDANKALDYIKDFSNESTSQA